VCTDRPTQLLAEFVEEPLTGRGVLVAALRKLGAGLSRTKPSRPNTRAFEKDALGLSARASTR
jgi:hypothetical protein